MSPQKAFGQTLREYRTSARISQDELAHLSGLDRTFISLLERGLRQPSLSTIFQLAVALGTTPSALVSDVERMLRRARSR
jgi:transcriptional regulator with XRE-family HTH domain